MSLLIDVHTHVFNADDIPVKGFLKARGIPGFIASLLDMVLQWKAEPSRRGSHLSIFDSEIDEKSIDEFLRAVGAEDEELARQANAFRATTRRGDPCKDDDGLSDYIRMIGAFTKTQSENVKKLFKLYEPDLAVPLMMDMRYWFQDSIDTSYTDQISIMESLINKTQGKLLPFIAFNPEHERRYRSGALPNGSAGALELVKEAIEKRGFLGVKLYPPLGHTPIGRSPKFPQYSNDYSTILWELYEYCENNDVPITAHCSNGGAVAGKDYGKLAAPFEWNLVLSNFPSIRLNLAHFGNDKDYVCGSKWTRQIAEFIDNDDYPNIFADCSCHRSVESKFVRNEFFFRLSHLMGRFPRLEDRYMFGTDWHMLSITEKAGQFLEVYKDHYLGHFGAVATEKFLWGNALNFLGLLPGNKNRERIKKYYESKEITLPKWFTETEQTRSTRTVYELKDRENSMEKKPFRKALLVGINDYNGNGDLKGCVNDVTNMRNILKTYYGFNNSDIHVLIDKRATKKNILLRLKNLVKEANNAQGGMAVFHISSHGSQIRDWDGDELKDQLDEIICPHDMDWDGQFITDDTLNEIFIDLHKDVLLEVFLDCCHSGDGLREHTFNRPPELGPENPTLNRYMNPPNDIVCRTEGETEKLSRKSFRNSYKDRTHHILWAACRDNQTSADAPIDGTYNGAFTYYFCKHMRESGGHLSRAALLDRIRNSLSHNGYSQVPQLECEATRRDKRTLE